MIEEEDKKALIKAAQSIGQLAQSISMAFCVGRKAEWLEFLMSELKNKEEAVKALSPDNHTDTLAIHELGCYCIGVNMLMKEMADTGEAYLRWNDKKREEGRS